MSLPHDIKESARYLTLIVSGNEYLINMSWVQSIERAEKLEPSDHVNQDVVGTYKLGPKIINVYSLNKTLGYENTYDLSSGRIVIVKKKELNIAIYTDSVSGIIEASRDQVFELPVIASRKLSDYFDKIVMLGDRILFSIFPDYLEGELSGDVKFAEENVIADFLNNSASCGRS